MVKASRWTWFSIGLGAMVFALAVFGPGGALPALAWDDEDCEACHSEPSIVEEGGAYLFVDPVRFEKTSHAEVGCTSCHESVTEEHPDDGLRPSRAGCGECHDDVEAQYAQSSHADNAGCTDCHNPHEVRSVTRVSGVEVNSTCLECHDEGDIVSVHGVWLPQTTLHIRALPCTACHTASEDYVITFYIESLREGAEENPVVSLATREELLPLSQKEDDITRVVDLDGNGQVSVEELRTFYREGKIRGLRLWGMMTPEVATHDYGTLDNRWDCSFCHASGPETVQKSYVALPGPAGAYKRISIEAGAVLEALYGSPDFYMVGATRSKALTYFGLAIVLGGMAVPLGHGTLRLLTMRNRREK